MFCKKFSTRMFMTFFIVSTMIFLTGCDNNEISASGKNLSAADKQITAESQKIQKALDLFENSDYKSAIELCDEISALNLNTAAEYKLRGEYLIKAGEYYHDIMNYEKGQELFDSAVRDYNSAIQLNPNDVDSYINRGNFYCRHGKQDLAIQDYDKILELDPNNVDAYIGRAEAYQNTGHLSQRDLNKAIELNPNSAKAYMARSVVYLNIGQNNLALEDANKAVELNPENPEVYNNRGLVYNNLNQYDSAIQDYNRAIELEPKNFSAHKGLGMVYSSLKQYSKAIEELDKAIEIYPELNAVNLRRHCYHLSMQERNSN